MIGLITTARHEREIAAKDAEIAGLMKRLEDTARRHAITEREACDQATVIAKRPRDAKGHFLPTKGREA